MKNLKAKIVSIFLVICMSMLFVGCDSDTKKPNAPVKPVTPTLSSPTNLRVIDNGDIGVVRWNAVQNAEVYVVTINDGEPTTTQNTYTYIQPLTLDYNISVVARAKGYNDSSASVYSFKKHEVAVSINGGTDCKSGKKLQLSAVVENADDKSVEWEITDGEDFAKISDKGLLEANVVTGDKLITVKATSKADPSVSASKRITITAKPELTQEMLDALNDDTVEFIGFMEINKYTYGITNNYIDTVTMNVNTAMDGTHWYGSYETGVGKRSLYCREDNGNAYQVGVSFENKASLTEIVDEESGNVLTWTEAGLYNKLRNLSLADFEFSDELWRWEFKGKGSGLDAQARSAYMREVIDTANPYNFIPKNLALIVEDGAIAGIYSEAEDDYTIYQQYVARCVLTSAINVGSKVKVPKLDEYKHYDFQDKLADAIVKMQSLDSYTTEYLNISTAYGTMSYDGYLETITADACYIKPYDFVPQNVGSVAVGNGTRTFTNNNIGFVKCSDALYNSFSEYDGEFTANRAFTDDFSNAKPSFAFSADIFTAYVDNEDGSTTYFADEPMNAVATTFYKGVGNDMSLYGMFADSTVILNSFSPFVTVSKEGYITNASFYYYLGNMYGAFDIAYRDFNTASIDKEIEEGLASIKSSPRNVPTSWNDVEIIITEESTNENEVTENALTYLQKLFDDETIADQLPFFAEVLGDTYGFGMTYSKNDGTGWVKPCVVFYYDVPLEMNYTIDAPIKAIKNLLVANGFERTADDIYVKGDVRVQPVDNNLDLNIYVWDNTPSLI